MTAAFQSSAFQNNTFQVGTIAPEPPAPTPATSLLMGVVRRWDFDTRLNKWKEKQSEDEKALALLIARYYADRD